MSQLLCTLGLKQFIPPQVVSISTNNMAKDDDTREHAYHQRGADARLKILKFLYQGKKTTKQIHEMLGTTKNNAIYHIKILVESGLIKATAKQGSRFNFWAISYD